MRKALGRGLGALIPDAEFVETVKLIDIDNIVRSPYQPREEAEKNIDGLVESIKQHGILEPVLVRKEGDKYILVAGERRFLAAQRAGMTKIPARVLDVSDATMAEIALVENLMREDLNPLEEAVGIETLANKFKYTHEKIGELLGVDRVTITNKLRLLRLAEPVKVFLRDGSISEGHAKLILALDEKEQVQLANRIVRNRLSVRETERLIQRLKSEQEKSTRTKYVKMVSNTTGLRVSVKISKSGAGEVTIRFNNKEEFVKLAKILGLKPEK